MFVDFIFYKNVCTHKGNTSMPLTFSMPQRTAQNGHIGQVSGNDLSFWSLIAKLRHTHKQPNHLTGFFMDCRAFCCGTKPNIGEMEIWFTIFVWPLEVQKRISLPAT
jgi:hypothetical protein